MKYNEVMSHRISWKKKSAFTLAEVLITLGIIGVVAALTTIPAMINNTHNKELETGLKKAYSTLSQAIMLYENDNGVPITPGSLGGNELKPILMRYLTVVKDCGNGAGDSATACVPNATNIDDPARIIYDTYNGKTKLNTAFIDDGQFIMNNSMLVLIENPGNSDRVFISVDINGFNKKPNRAGHDLFTFQINNNGVLLPMGVEGTYFYSENNQYCSQTATNNYNGFGCTKNALSDKNYFKNLPK